MSDLIDRQAAIEYLMTNMKWFNEDEYESDDDYKRECITDLINGVPSADPGLDEWCTDCKEYDQKRHCCPRFNRVIRETLNDMPERKTGHWIHIRDEEDGNSLYECSYCHMGEVHVPIVEVSYCWNCGAKMEGEQNDRIN